MGCDHYNVYGSVSDKKGNAGWEELSILFSESDEDWSCVCTFPHNYSDGRLYYDIVRSLALLGAALAMAHHGEFRDNDGYVYLPGCIPQWIQDEIKRLVPEEAHDAAN